MRLVGGAKGRTIKLSISVSIYLSIQGETDWKVLVIDVFDPLAENLNDIHDIEKLMPGFLSVSTGKGLR